MKSLRIPAIITVVIVLALYSINRLKKPLYTELNKQITPIPRQPTRIQTLSAADVYRNGRIYRMSWFISTNPAAIELIPNFSEKLTSETYRNNGCSLLANGGFYSENYTPIGLFAIQDNVISQAKQSSLFNGFFSVTPNGKGVISEEIPSEDSLFRLQSGPIVRKNGAKVMLNLKSDEAARRIFVATDDKNLVLFGALYDPDQTFKGPLLADVPELLDDYQKMIDFTLDTALNLDGGSASVFVNQEVRLQELTSIGSAFCIK